MKYMLMMNAPRGDGRLGRDEVAAGRPSGPHRVHEATSPRNLRTPASSSAAKGWRPRRKPGSCARRQDGAPAVTDGPFAEAKEFLAGYWIVDVETPAARLRDCRAGVGGAGAGRQAAEHADRSARGDERTARRSVTHAGLDASDREPAARARAAGSRRDRPPLQGFRRGRRCGAGGARRGGVQWPREGVPDNPRGWLIQVATRRMTDHLRSETARRRAEDAGRAVVDRRSVVDGFAMHGTIGARRHARAAVHVLSSRAHRARRPSRSRCAPSAASRRRRSPTRSSCRKRRWRSASAARSRRIKASRRAVPHADETRARGAARPPCCTCCI